jgi:hypothetical protein
MYGLTVSPSERPYATINESTEGISFSWEFSSLPVPVTGAKPTAKLTIDSTKFTPEKMAALEAVLYGDESNEATLPKPDEVRALLVGE